MPRLFNLLVAVLFVVAPMAGCGPSLSERELGEIEYGVPKNPAEEDAKKAPEDTAFPAVSQPAKQPAPEPPTPEQPKPDSATESPK